MGRNGFYFDNKPNKTRRSLSGIACPTNGSGQRRCLVVFDEGVEARYVVLDGNGYMIENERVVLRESDGELDAEGAATDGRYYYVTGSHSAKRSDCENNPASRHVIRFAVDPTTGRVLRSPAGDPKGSLVQYTDSGRLWAIMASLAALSPYVGDQMCLGSPPKGKNGVDIEGLAVRNGRLYFGFRGPALHGEALVLAVDADAFFSGASPNPEITRIVVGEHRGIRDLHAVKDGILLLAGPDDDKGSNARPWIMALWDGESGGDTAVKPQVLAQLDLSGFGLRACDEETKPEALAVLEDSPTQFRVVILSDGMCDGGPLAFRIPR